MKEQTVFLPVNLKDEIPEKAGGYFVIRDNGVIATDSFGINGSRFWSDTKSWLKPQTGFFFTKEELNKLISEIMEFTRANSDQCDLKNQYLKKKGLL